MFKKLKAGSLDCGFAMEDVFIFGCSESTQYDPHLKWRVTLFRSFWTKVLVRVACTLDVPKLLWFYLFVHIKEEGENAIFVVDRNLFTTLIRTNILLLVSKSKCPFCHPKHTTEAWLVEYLQLTFAVSFLSESTKKVNCT